MPHGSPWLGHMAPQQPAKICQVSIPDSSKPVWGHGGQKKKSYAEGKPSQSHFYAGKLLRSRRLWAISRSSGHSFCVPFSLLGSWDLEEHDWISLVANWDCCDVLLSFWTEIKKPPRQRQRLGDVGKVVSNSVINIRVMVCCLLFHFRSANVYMDVIIPLLFSFFH